MVGISGVFRSGKSFMMNFFLRYLQGLSKNLEGDWLTADGLVLGGDKGFHWRGKPERDTTGILVWPEPFIVREMVSGKEIVVLLMDTQGLWDNKMGAKGDALLFALSTLLTSVQVC